MNPFSLTFGKAPVALIRQDKQINDIVDGFSSQNPDFQVCMITGVRGSGKTVLMGEINTRLQQLPNWIVVEVSPERDILHAVAAELSHRKELLQIFKDAKINLSLFGLGIEIDAEPPITDVVVALNQILEQLTKKGKKVLIALDEAVANKQVREFTSQFQIYIRKNYNVFLLMTGLYDRIYELQNEETLTFLYRAPKFQTQSLNFMLVAKQYQKIFKIPYEEALSMAYIVQGYPYAYQVLGYLCYKNQCGYHDVLDELDAYLGEYVYDKLYIELSEKDRIVLNALSRTKTGKVSDIRASIDMDPSEFSVYRDRLLKKGLIRSGKYGYLEFALPRFKQYLDYKMLFESM